MQTGITSYQHPEIGSVAMHKLWIPAVASILVAGYFVLYTSQNDRAVTAAHAEVPGVRIAPASNAVPQVLNVGPAVRDEAVAAHQALDPVGAGLGVAP